MSEPKRFVRHSARLAAVVILAASASAQFRVQPVAEHPGEVALRLMLRKLASAGTFMQTTAHPDDEDNGLLAMLGYGRGFRAVLVSATRGEGGQNEIGPELFEALSVLRTAELLAAHRFDGAEQFFTRAVDFGYSFSVEENLARWGHQEILGDFVRHIRTIRPDVIAGFLCDGGGGGQAHQASALLTREAFRAAADPARFPDQIAEGLRPWQARRLFCTDMSSFVPSRGDATHPTTIVQDAFDPLLGRTYGELGIEARSMHKCQGTSQLLPLPGARVARTYRLQDATIGKPDVAVEDLFEGIDTSLGGLAAFAGAHPPELLVTGLQRISAAIAEAERLVQSAGQFAAVQPLARGLTSVRTVRKELRTLGLGDDVIFEIDFRLQQKEDQFQQAIVLAQGLRLEALANDGLVTAGQPLTVSILGSNPGRTEVTVSAVALTGVDGSFACSATVQGGGAFECESPVRVAADVPLSTPYWHPRSDAARYDFDPGVPFGVPFRPAPLRATMSLAIAGVPITVERGVEYRYGHIVAGEKRMDVQVVPSLAVTTAPEIAVIPAGGEPGGQSSGNSAPSRELVVTVINHQRGAVAGTVSIDTPPGWSATPGRAPVALDREDEAATVKFSVAPPASVQAGDYQVVAQVQTPGAAGHAARVGYDVIEYPHVRRHHLVKPSGARLTVIDVTIEPGLEVGYVMGVGDQVPQAIEQLGAAVHMVGPEELASGDLSIYDVIMTGVRAYERRPDLRANNHRLLEYAASGGTVLVQYNKFEFNQAQYGPFPARVGSDRVTDETAPVEVLVPRHEVFTTPNRIGPEAWEGWVQERGLYFLAERDSRYVDLVRLADPFELNPGPKTGALVEARVGKGRWLYIGLGLWRQLPAGTPGAYRILANLLSLGSS